TDPGGPGGVGGVGGRAGLLGQPGTAGISTLLSPNQTLIYIDQFGNPLLNISVGGGPSSPVIVDSGASGLVVPPHYVTGVALGTPGATGSVSYGLSSTSRLFVDYQTYQTTVNFGNGIVTGSTTVGVATSASLVTQTPAGTTSQPINDLSLLPAYLGVGPNNNFPFSDPTNAALPTNMNQGVLFNMPRGLLEFGPNSLPPTVDLNGAPLTVVQVQINNELPQTVGAVVDSGGVGGAIPQSLVPGLSIGNRLPEGTTISVYTINGVHLYTQTVTAANSPLVVPSAPPSAVPGQDAYYVFNTGNYPFSVGPIYIANNDATGTTIFNRLI
ncbi:PecA family PE domain-processing aspartic protease, partial [Mycobacterium riyadhense]|uniref:PecA family PE domain-processing aspartic protease n=1 Tax=Mycobacterium riyadhense TaxID=486698 RepID=UPI00146FB301